MSDTPFIFILALATLIVAVAYAGWQISRARKAKRQNETVTANSSVGQPRDPATDQPRREMPTRS